MSVINQQKQIHEAEIVFDSVAESVLIIENMNGGWGTGFVTKAKSGKLVIVTNDHICDSDPPIFLISHRSSESLRSEIHIPTMPILRDSEHDLCLIAIPPGLKVEPLPIADEVYIDSKVYIIGYPTAPLLSSAQGYIRGTQTIGSIMERTPLDQCKGKKYHIETVSIKRKDGKKQEEQRCIMTASFLFTDSLGEFGASGSPALNGDGEVVGVMSAITGQARPFAYLVPLNNLKKFLSKY